MFRAKQSYGGARVAGVMGLHGVASRYRWEGNGRESPMGLWDVCDAGGMIVARQMYRQQH